MQRKQNRWKYAIEERRKEVAQMLAQGHSETDIAQLLGVHFSTICRDVKFLKQLSQRFVFDLAKGDLVHYYKQYIDEIEEVRREAGSSLGLFLLFHLSGIVLQVCHDNL